MTGNSVYIRSGTDANVFTSSVTISHDGNVGIGTDSPGATFEVSGAGQTNTLIRSTGNLSSSIRFVNSANSDVVIVDLLQATSGF